MDASTEQVTPLSTPPLPPIKFSRFPKWFVSYLCVPQGEEKWWVSTACMQINYSHLFRAQTLPCWSGDQWAKSMAIPPSCLTQGKNFILNQKDTTDLIWQIKGSPMNAKREVWLDIFMYLNCFLRINMLELHKPSFKKAKVQLYTFNINNWAKLSKQDCSEQTFQHSKSSTVSGKILI